MHSLMLWDFPMSKYFSSNHFLVMSEMEICDDKMTLNGIRLRFSIYQSFPACGLSLLVSNVRSYWWSLLHSTNLTRMHSSRMRTARISSRHWGCLPGGGCLPGWGCLPRGGCLPGGVSIQGGVCLGGCMPRGVSAWGCLSRGVCVSQHALGQAPPPPPALRGQNSWHTLVKSLSLRNYVADGDKLKFTF